jgi:hypothetical protein
MNKLNAPLPQYTVARNCEHRFTLADNWTSFSIMQPKLNRRQLGLLLSLLVLNAIALFPLMTTGYCGDDVLNSQIRGEMIRTHLSLWGVDKLQIGTWVINQGRFFPLAFYMYTVFYVVGSVFLFKLLVLTVVLASLSAFYCFLRRLTGSVLLPSACLLLLPLVTQFRAVWDPILGFCAQYPLMTLLLFFSLTLFLRHLDDHNRRALIVAAILFLCCGLIFETSYLMCALYLVVAYSRLKKLRAALLAALPFIAVTGLLGTISFFLKKFAEAPSQIYQPNYNPAQILKSYAVQSFGAVPFSYYWLDPYRVFSSMITRWPDAIEQGLPLLVALALITAFWIRRGVSSRVDDGQKATTADLLWLGGLLFALPQAFISLSPKYQTMPWGAAYLPVYLSRLGLTLLLAIFCLFVYRRSRMAWDKRPALSIVLVVVWLSLFAVNLQNNWLVAQSENELFWYPRVLTEEAIAEGLLAGVKQGSILLVDGTSLWDNANEYIGASGRLYSVYSLNEAADLTPAFRAAGGSCQGAAGQQECAFGPTSSVYTVQIRHLANGTGAVLLAHVNQTYQANNKIRGLLADQVNGYFRLPSAVPEPKGSISGRFVQPKRTGASLFRVGEDRLEVLGHGGGWKLLAFHPGESFDALSLRGDISPQVPDSAVLVVKKESAWELRSAGPPLLHFGYDGGTLGAGVQQPAISFTNEMSIDLLVSPEDNQVPNADILSNHATDYRGLAIEQLGDHTNHFSVSLGNGTSWMNAGQFSLEPGRRSYVSLQIEDKQTMLYVNGKLIAKTLQPAQPVSTNRPLYVGNWIGGGRPFNGFVGEVLISNGNKSGDEIAADAVRLVPKGESH